MRQSGLIPRKNLYGFAGGDPVNFSDPFGLCPIPILCEAMDVAALALDVRDIGKNGWSWGRGLALTADAAAVFLPVIPAGAGIGYRAAGASRRLRGAMAAAGQVARAGDEAHHIVAYSSKAGRRRGR